MGTDVTQQIVRIIMYALTGFLVKAGLDGEGIQMVAGAVTGVVALIWWIIWNRKKATA